MNHAMLHPGTCKHCRGTLVMLQPKGKVDTDQPFAMCPNCGPLDATDCIPAKEDGCNFSSRGNVRGHGFEANLDDPYLEALPPELTWNAEDIDGGCGLLDWLKGKGRNLGTSFRPYQFAVVEYHYPQGRRPDGTWGDCGDHRIWTWRSRHASGRNIPKTWTQAKPYDPNRGNQFAIIPLRCAECDHVAWFAGQAPQGAIRNWVDQERQMKDAVAPKGMNDLYDAALDSTKKKGKAQ